MTKYEEYKGVKDVGKKAKHGNYAHFPGSGPPNTFCRTCKSCVLKHGTYKMVCAKWCELMGQSRVKAEPISELMESCKYYWPQ